MTEDEKKIEQKIMPWRFWFFVLLSLFLITTFGLYLPMRFQYQGIVDKNAMSSQGGHMMAGSNMVHGASVYHEESDIREGLAVNLSVTPIPIVIGSSTRLDFFVNQKPGNIPVDSSQLSLMHAKRMHVIGVRNDMNEFFHIHPTPTSTPGMFTIEHIFSKPGEYKIWSEVSKEGVDHIIGHPQTSVEGQGQKTNKDVFITHSAIVSDYQIVMNYEEPLVKQQQSIISFEIHDSLGREVQVELYLEADMHLTIIKDDWKQFIHTHPSGSRVAQNRSQTHILIKEARADGAHTSAGTTATGHGIPFSTMFPEGGLYRVYAQFRPKGINLNPDEALMGMFWIRVSDQPPLILFALAANWWLKLIISLILITIISVGVKKILNTGIYS